MSATDTATLPDYAPIPGAALGPAFGGHGERQERPAHTGAVQAAQQAREKDAQDQRGHAGPRLALLTNGAIAVTNRCVPAWAVMLT